MKNTILFLALVLAQSASALSLNFKSSLTWDKQLEYSANKMGEGYSENRAYNIYVNQHEPKFDFKNQGGRIEFTDLKHKITYVIDLNNAREQDLNPQYLDFLKKQSEFKDFAKAIERISISDIQSANVAGSDKIVGLVNYYLNYRLPSGMVLKAKLQVSVSLETQRLYVRQFLDDKGNPSEVDNGTGQTRVIQAEVLVASATGNAKVVSVDMGNSMTNVVVKSVLEMTIGILPKAFEGSAVLFHANGY